jgi:isoquinoline 1-oxidoreductase alpha subunit
VINLRVNGETHTVEAPATTPLLWVLRDVLHLTGTKSAVAWRNVVPAPFTWMAEAVRSCVTPIGSIGARAITTIEAVGTCRSIGTRWQVNSTPEPRGYSRERTAFS